uniref:Methyl-CpG binding domain protein 1a n=1 Tax=Denticeps clupeoides TaxID=299321 RepID=A0AAY4E9F0_9TELE
MFELLSRSNCFLRQIAHVCEYVTLFLNVFRNISRRRHAWLDWPVLGAGWKRKEVIRWSGVHDVHYMSPRGHVFRSKLKLVKSNKHTDLRKFHYASGLFLDESDAMKDIECPDGGALVDPSDPSERIGSVTSMPSWNSAPGDFCETPHSSTQTPQRRGSSPPRPSQTFRNPLHPTKASPLGLSPARQSADGPLPNLLGRVPPQTPSPTFTSIQLLAPTRRPDITMRNGSSLPNGSVAVKNLLLHQGRIECSMARSTDCQPRRHVGGCAKCGSDIPGIEAGEETLCPSCRPDKKPKQRIVFRKVGQGRWVLGRTSEVDGMTQQRRKRKYWTMQKKRPSLQDAHDSDTGDCFKDEDDIDDDEQSRNRRHRRACLRCAACLRKDCGKCDFCMDKPKFGGSNKKRQKCRMRQCQNQAMVRESTGTNLNHLTGKHTLVSDWRALFSQWHLLPHQKGRRKGMPSTGWVGPGRRRKASRLKPSRPRSKRKRRRPIWEGDFTDEEGGDDGDKVKEEDLNVKKSYGYNHGKTRNYSLKKDEDGDDLEGAFEAALTSDFSDQDNGDDTFVFENVEPYELSIQGCFTAPNGDVEMVASFQSSLNSRDQTGEPLAVDGTGELSSNGIPQLSDDVVVVRVDVGAPAEDDVTEVDEVTPVITQIFSLAEGTQDIQGSEADLLQLLESLRRTVLPVHWVGRDVPRPMLQLLQCSKRSTMADTTLQIELGFLYQISVQNQPLLLTHPLYEGRPSRLSSVSQVVALLLDLERLAVCQGHPGLAPRPDREPVLCVRAAACQLLVPASQERCDKCRDSLPDA